MNFKLLRTSYDHDGVFGQLLDDQGNVIAATLEHAYESGNGDGSYVAKLNKGPHLCVRGLHRLHGMSADFTTFEITGVPGHSNILFHWGNYNRDSEGCVLLGRRVAANPETPSENMITSSRNTFNKFLDIVAGIDQFTLTVE